jgi:shikimate kinase
MGANVNPDTAWAIGAVASALVTTGPAYLAVRRSRGTAREEGSATREALLAVRDELRSDIREVRDWQAAHQTEHAVYGLGVRRPLETRDNE